MVEDKFPVVIVGGGPVGFGLAIELGQRGIECAVIERYPTPLPIPKGQNMTGRTMEHFYSWGAEKAMHEARVIPRENAGGVTVYGQLLSDYSYDWLQRHWVRPYYFAQNERLPQYVTEAVLRKRAAAIPQITSYFGWEAQDISQDENAARVVIGETAGTDKQTVCGDYLVGCDGSWSMVREQTGLTQTVAEHDKRMVLLVFHAPQLHELLEERYPNKSYYNVLKPDLKGYWLFFGRVDLGNSWFFHAPVPADTTKDNFNFAAYLHEAVGAEFEIDFEYIGFWDLRIALADNYRDKRVFIAGDAAHSHPPYGGYGINTGFEDARNLGWKLAATIQGWGGEELLDSYSLERQPVFASTAGDFIEKSISTDGEFVANFNPDRDLDAFEAAWSARSQGARGEVDAYEPHYEGSPLVGGPGQCSAKGSHSFKARAGHHLPPLVLTSGKNIFEEIGAGFTLISLGGAENEVLDFEVASNKLGAPFQVIRDQYSEQLSKYGAHLILVRPDHFIAWIGDTFEGNALTVLQRSTAALLQTA